MHKKEMKENLAKFSENLSIHGVRHIFSYNGSKFTKLFWSIIILGSVTTMLFYYYQLYVKLNQIPDINTRTGVRFTRNIPFPAITVCTPIFARYRLINFYNIARQFRMHEKTRLNLSVDEQNYLASNMQTCHPEYGNLAKLASRNRSRNDIVNLLNESFLLTSETFLECGNGIFSSKNKCLQLFNRVLTDRGFCYSYNLQDFNIIFNKKTISEDFHCYKRSKGINDGNDVANKTFQWSLDTGYTHHNEVNLIPERAVRGNVFGFNLHLNEMDVSNLCPKYGNVFSYFIHLPNEIMTPLHQEYYNEFEKRKEVTLTATSYKTHEEMRKFSPKSRGCYFQGEKPLKFFKTYTKALCDMECMANHSLRICGCVRFSMPRLSTTPVCTIDNSKCAFDSMQKWPDHDDIDDRFEATCGCLKTCNDIKYEIKFEKTSTSEAINLISDAHNLSKG